MALHLDFVDDGGILEGHLGQVFHIRLRMHFHIPVVEAVGLVSHLVFVSRCFLDLSNDYQKPDGHRLVYGRTSCLLLGCLTQSLQRMQLSYRILVFDLSVPMERRHKSFQDFYLVFCRPSFLASLEDPEPTLVLHQIYLRIHPIL